MQISSGKPSTKLKTTQKCSRTWKKESWSSLTLFFKFMNISWQFSMSFKVCQSWSISPWMWTWGTYWAPRPCSSISSSWSSVRLEPASSICRPIFFLLCSLKKNWKHYYRQHIKDQRSAGRYAGAKSGCPTGWQRSKYKEMQISSSKPSTKFKTAPKYSWT